MQRTYEAYKTATGEEVQRREIFSGTSLMVEREWRLKAAYLSLGFGYFWANKSDREWIQNDITQNDEELVKHSGDLSGTVLELGARTNLVKSTMGDVSLGTSVPIFLPSKTSNPQDNGRTWMGSPNLSVTLTLD